jgi:hypothetical protein
MGEKQPEPPTPAPARPTPQLVLDMSQFNMPFLQAEPAAPSENVIFRMPLAGTMQANYHAVIEGHGCLALIYDTRYHGGQQYVPPADTTEDYVPVHVGRSNKDYNTSAIGAKFQLGVLDVVVLVTVDLPQETPHPPQVPEAHSMPAGMDMSMMAMNS